MTQYHAHTTVLRRPEVEARVGLSKSSIYALIRSGNFPKPIRLSERAVAWRAQDIQAWLDEREQC